MSQGVRKPAGPPGRVRWSVEAHRSRLYRKIEQAGTRGASKWFLMGYTDLSERARRALDGLIEDGWVDAHPSYRGDGRIYDLIYVATGKGKGDRP